MTRLLVVGADRVDAGKTTFSTGLLERIDGVGVKPRAGNDHWFDHDDVRRAVGEGRLYGKDARRLAEASALDLEPEAINPVHRLWRPAPGGGQGMLGPAHRRFVADRIGPVGIGGDDSGHATARRAEPQGPSPGAEVAGVVVNASAAVPDAVADGLPIDDATGVRSLDALNELMATRHQSALADLAERIEASDRVVVESYADVARPIDCPFDAVAAVEPGRARIYDGDRFARACRVASSSPRDGRLERRVEDVVDPLDPVASVRLPALTDRERADPARVARAYEHAYDRLIEAARH